MIKHWKGFLLGLLATLIAGGFGFWLGRRCPAASPSAPIPAGEMPAMPPLSMPVAIPDTTEPYRRPAWSIGLVTGDTPFALEPPTGVVNPVITAADVTDVDADFVADPFMLIRDSTYYMFFEVWDRELGRGKIALATSPDGLAWTYKQVVLAEGFHLSYPYVFEWEGEVYMVPESYQAMAVRLYRASEFPTRWELVQTLIEDDSFVDPSLLRYDGHWYLFVSQLGNERLRLFHAPDLFGPWVEHLRSPLVAGDPKQARPAGRFLAEGDILLRLAQDDDPDYGNSLRMFQITRLTPDDYAESPHHDNPVLKGSGAGWNADGMHHADLHLIKGRWFGCVDGWRLEPVRRQ